MDLVFGWRTAVLTVPAAVLLPLSVALFTSLRNGVAARTLATLLLVMVGVFVPWLIGFAGFYDQWHWLTFAPFSNPLFVPPLLFLHAHALAHGRWPARGGRHLVLGGVQSSYQAAAFLLPMPIKQRWAELAVVPGNLIGAVLLAASFVVYSCWIVRLVRRYRGALAAERSDDALFSAGWLVRSTLAFTALAVLWSAYLLADAVTPLGYKGLMPLYAAIAGFALYFGIVGWRHLALPFPTMADLHVAAAPAPSPRDWTAQGEMWAARVRAQAWQREEALTLRRLATLLGTNESYLSRALNEGLGVSFSDFINGLRCEDVAAALRGGDDRPLLDLALDAGFASKASFNRAFRRRYGTSPSAFRAAQRT